MSFQLNSNLCCKSQNYIVSNLCREPFLCDPSQLPKIPHFHSMSEAKRSECVGFSACVKHGHVVPSKCCWSIHRVDQLCLYSIQIRLKTPDYNASLSSNWTELELSLAIWLEKCKCLLTSLLCLTVYFQPNNTGFDTVGNNLGPSTCCLQHSKPRKIDMESQNTTFPQHERSEAERVRGPERTR